MAHFSPSIMARFPIETIRVRNSRKVERDATYYHFKGTLTEFFTLYREASSDSTAAGSNLRGIIQNAWAGPWTGLVRQPLADFLDSGRSSEAHEAFNKALAKLDVKGKASIPEYRVSGGVWSVPRYLSGHPQAAIYRPKTAKPAMTLEVCTSYPASANAEYISQVTSRIARAAWDYQKVGGSVSLTLHQLSKFAESQDGAQGLLLSIKIPLSDIASLATALSIQIDRNMYSTLAAALSGYGPRDALTTEWLVKPGLINLNGSDDEKALAAASIK